MGLPFFDRFREVVVDVELVDADTGRILATSQMPDNRLPDTFLRETQLNIAGESYFVVEAEPPTKAEFKKTKRLRIQLRAVETADPQNILFSLPSICDDAIPPSVQAESGRVFLLQEDDWRQREFVSSELESEIGAELADILRIHAEEAVGPGWKKLHLRQRIPSPLPAGLSWPNLAAALGTFETLAGVAFAGPRTRVEGSFAVQLPEDVVLWGIESAGQLEVLAAENLDGASPETRAALRRMAESASLCYVDWCRCQVHHPSGRPLPGSTGDPLQET